MTYSVIVQNKVMAHDVGSLNRSAKPAANIENGWAVTLSSKSTVAGEEEVWLATIPTSGTLDGLWIVASPEVVLTVSGTKQYKGINPDPQDFINLSGKVMDAFKPQIGDIITLTGDAITGSKSSNTHIVATDSQYEFAWAGSAAGSTLSLLLLRTTYIPIPDGSIGTGRVVAYQFEVVHN